MSQKPIIHHLSGYIQSMYLIENEAGLLLLDSGTSSDVKMVLSFIKENLKRPITDLKVVVISHAHPDHSGGAYYYRKETGALIVAPSMLNDWYAGLSGLFTYAIDIFLTYVVARKKKKEFRNVLFPRKIAIDKSVEEGDVIPIFNDWLALETPGHTSCDISLYHPNSGVIYIGDILISSSKGPFAPYPVFNPQEYKTSLNRLIELPINEYLLSHNGPQYYEKHQLSKVLEKTGDKPRRHRNTLPKILKGLLF